MGAITSAVAWALAIANDNTHGYDQTSRWSPNYDCSSFVIQAYEQAGVPVKSNGATYTGNMVSVFKRTGFKDVTSQIDLSTGDGLIAGDVVWKSGHVEMCSREGFLVGARINEKGTITGGETGDQTGNEISERTYYNSPWTVVLRYLESVTSDDVVSGNRYLTEDEMKINARYIYQFFKAQGWSINAIAGMLGNMERESDINPAIWQNLEEGNTTGGVGLVQWTPATNLINWANERGYDYLSMDTQLLKIMDEYTNGGQYYETDTYPLSFYDFSISTESPEYLASVFLHNYERAGVSAETERQENARKWYTYLSEYEFDEAVIGPDTETTTKKGLSLMMIYLATRG